MAQDHEFGRSAASPSLASPSLEAGSATPSLVTIRWNLWSEARRLEAEEKKLRARLREMDRQQALAKLSRLPPQQRQVLGAFVEEADSEFCYGFDTIAAWSGLKRRQVSRACKALRRLGFISFHTGLFNDDGEVAGSGYALCDAGRDWWRAREAPEDGSQSPVTSDGEVSKAAQPLQTTEPKVAS